MKRQIVMYLGFAIAFITSQALMAQPSAKLLPPVLGKILPVNAKDKEDAKKAKEKDKDKKVPEKKEPAPPPPDLFAPITSAIGDYPTFFNPAMMGEKQVWFARQRRGIVGTQTTTVAVGATTTTNVAANTGVRNVLVPIAQRGGSNIAENFSPMPQDRVFATWNYYNAVGFGPTGQNAPLTTQTTTAPVLVLRNNVLVTSTTTTTTVIPGASRVDLNREVFGFEKTLLNGLASIEVRAPIDQMGGGDANFGYSNFGDLTVVGKYAFYLDRATGNVVSGGLALTVPTGRSVETTDGNFHDVLFQPYVGYLWNFNRCFVQGVHSIVIPSDSQDVTLAFNSLGLNYWLYRGNPDRLLTFIVPSVEAHVTTPLNHRDLNGPIVVPDTVVLTGGAHFGVGRRSTLTFGAATPVTGPRPYNIEGFMQLNIRY